MIINFNEIETVVSPNFKGGEKEFISQAFSDGAVKIMKGKLVQGASLGMHTHETNCEVLYVISGTATFTCDGAAEIVKAGECHYCPNGHTHCLINNEAEDLIFLAVIPEK